MPRVCDGQDNDCDTALVDDFRSGDVDGFRYRRGDADCRRTTCQGDASSSTLACTQPDGHDGSLVTTCDLTSGLNDYHG